MNNSEHVLVFVKNPKLGKVKTRLAAGIGEEKALDVYLQLLAITRKVVLNVDVNKHVFYSEQIADDDWDKAQFIKHNQIGADLGDRMKNAFKKLFDVGATKAVIIGSDCPQITPEIIRKAFSVLDENDAVIGPAKDGGYYLLGMKKEQPFLFENKKWSTDSVFEDTVLDLIKNRLTYHKLETLSDLDTIYDLHLLESRD